MGFFAEFSTWLNALLSTYIAANTSRIAAALEPAVVTLGVLYVMGWGVLQLTGQIEQPFLAGLKRIAMLALVFGVGLRLWLYNALLVDTFFNAPAQLAAQVVGAYDSVDIVDAILFNGDDTATLLLQKGGVLNGNFSYYLGGFAVYLIVGVTAIYTMFLLSLSRIALSVLLALGPLFLGLLFFEGTKRFVEAWFAQLTNYAFIAVLTVLVAALMLTVLSTAAQQAAAAGGNIQLAQAVRVCLAAGLTFLMMRQVMPMAAGLASGISLSTLGLVSGGFLRGAGSLGQFTRGAVMDRESSRWDSWSRKAGYALQRSVRGAVGDGARLARGLRPNSIRRGGGR